MINTVNIFCYHLF